MRRLTSANIGLIALFIIIVFVAGYTYENFVKPHSWRISESLEVSPTPPWRIDNENNSINGKNQTLVVLGSKMSSMFISPWSDELGSEMSPWNDLIEKEELKGRINSFTWKGRSISSMVGVVDKRTGELMMEFRIPESSGVGVVLYVGSYPGSGESSLATRSNEEFFKEVSSAIGLKVISP